ncbi:hypothetical protein Golob_006999, partial [Gossypium lobatum]|nr:hypothetical protein [Gossypium lobatum]
MLICEKILVVYILLLGVEMEGSSKLGGILFLVLGSVFVWHSKKFMVSGISATCWLGWISRNEKVFKGKTTTLDSLIYQTKLRSFVWARVVYEECIFTKSDWWGWPRKS